MYHFKHLKVDPSSISSVAEFNQLVQEDEEREKKIQEHQSIEETIKIESLKNSIQQTETIKLLQQQLLNEQIKREQNEKESKKRNTFSFFINLSVSLLAIIISILLHFC